MSVPTTPGSNPEQDPLSTMPEPARHADPMETPAPGELTTPQLPGLPPPGLTCTRQLPGFPEVPGYVLTSEIARGGMGVVYAAWETVLGREVALKTLLPGLAGHAEMAFQFEREARITARLPHPGVPPIYSIGTLADGRPYLTMKLIRGRTLATILSARQALCSQSTAELDPTTPDAPGMLLVFEQICQAVAFAHSKGIIHRDLKPQNIMVGPFGEVQVMDWGLSKSGLGKRGSGVGEDSDWPTATPPTALRGPQFDATQLGSAKGTPSYMPPEQARGEWDRVDACSDVFALGGLLCVMLTGYAPYVGPNMRVVLARATLADLDETYARLDTCGADTELAGLAKWCLAADPADRPPDAQTVATLVELYRLGQQDRLCELESKRMRDAKPFARSSFLQGGTKREVRPVGRWSDGWAATLLMIVVCLLLACAAACCFSLTSP